MFYPEDFKVRVRSIFPWKEIHRKLDSGDESLGRDLDTNAPRALSIDFILAASSLEEVQEKAKFAKKVVNLYHEWCTLYDEQNPR